MVYRDYCILCSLLMVQLAILSHPAGFNKEMDNLWIRLLHLVSKFFSHPPVVCIWYKNGKKDRYYHVYIRA